MTASTRWGYPDDDDQGETMRQEDVTSRALPGNVTLTDEAIDAALSEYWDLSERGWSETHRVAMRKAVLTALSHVMKEKADE